MSTNWWPLPMPWRWHKLLWHAVTMLWLKIWIITSSNPYHFPEVHIQKKWKYECCSSLCHFWLVSPMIGFGKDIFLEILLRSRRCFISCIVERNRLLYVYVVVVNKPLTKTNCSTCIKYHSTGDYIRTQWQWQISAKWNPAKKYIKESMKVDTDKEKSSL